MGNLQHLLVSLEPRHAESILAGHKRVELRRRPMNVSAGATMWMYAKLPVGSVVGKATVSAIHTLSPTTIWRRFGKDSGITRREFFEYFGASTQGVALVLGETIRLEKAISLKYLREAAGVFSPPQFFTWLQPEHPIFKATMFTASPELVS